MQESSNAYDYNSFIPKSNTQSETKPKSEGFFSFFTSWTKNVVGYYTGTILLPPNLSEDNGNSRNLKQNYYYEY